LRFALGAFVQTQTHDIEQRYKIDDIDSDLSVTGWPDTLWLTKQVREDKDTAVFGELSYDITDALDRQRRYALVPGRQQFGRVFWLRQLGLGIQLRRSGLSRRCRDVQRCAMFVLRQAC
jgi:hypothetical protein